MRYFLGTPRFTPDLAISGDGGWTPSDIRRELQICILWNRLVHMPNHCLTKQLFNLDKNICKRNWSSDLKNLLCSYDMNDNFVLEIPVNILDMKKKMLQTFHNEWRGQALGVDKLRTYVRYKSQYCTETYVSLITNRQHRSILAQFRCGILPLKIETKRYQNLHLGREVTWTPHLSSNES